MQTVLTNGMTAMGLIPSPALLDRFSEYSRLLIEKNAVMNLTAITEPEQIASLHFLDSLSIAGHAELQNKTMIDVGTGAGFPGLPLKLLEPSLSLTLLDSQGKRVSFLSELCPRLGVPDAACIQGRAEELGRDPAFREKFDLAVSRAVAGLNILCELCLPFVKPGGLFIAMKSIDTGDEQKAAEPAVHILGGRLLPPVDYRIPGTEITHRLILIQKITVTPGGYPRRFSAIKKSPLQAR